MNITAQTDIQDGNHVTFSEKWNPFCRLSENMLLMVRHISEEIVYAPLYIRVYSKTREALNSKVLRVFDF